MVRWSGVSPVRRSAVADRLDRLVDRLAELAVEHRTRGYCTPGSSGRTVNARRSQNGDLVTLILDIENLGDQIGR